MNVLAQMSKYEPTSIYMHSYNNQQLLMLFPESFVCYHSEADVLRKHFTFGCSLNRISSIRDTEFLLRVLRGLN